MNETLLATHHNGFLDLLRHLPMQSNRYGLPFFVECAQCLFVFGILLTSFAKPYQPNSVVLNRENPLGAFGVWGALWK